MTDMRYESIHKYVTKSIKKNINMYVAYTCRT